MCPDPDTLKRASAIVQQCFSGRPTAKDKRLWALHIKTVVKKMEVATFHQTSEAGSPRGGEAVHYGCSMSTMSYFTFAMIGIYTAINVNNVS